MAKKPHNVKIVQYFFTETHVLAHTSYDPNGKRDGTVQNISHSVNQIQTEKLQYGVGLKVETDEDKSKNQPYTYVVEAFGIFEPISSETDEDIDDYRSNVEIVGLQTLYGAIREHLATVTARAPWSTFTINTLNLNLQAKNDTNKEE